MLGYRIGKRMPPPPHSAVLTEWGGGCHKVEATKTAVELDESLDGVLGAV